MFEHAPPHMCPMHQEWIRIHDKQTWNNPS